MLGVVSPQKMVLAFGTPSIFRQQHVPRQCKHVSQPPLVQRRRQTAVVVASGYYGNAPGKPAGKGAYGADIPSPPQQIQQVGKPQAPFGTSPEEPVLTEAAGAALQRISNFSFWSQLALSTTSAVILFFAITSGTPPGQMPNISVYFTAFGVVTSVISTFLSSGFKRTARRVLLKGEDVAARGVAASLLRNVGLNLWGLGATIVGLQAAVGTLLAKTLTTSTTNPYITNPSSSYTTPAALDVFSVQASTNTVLAHFASIVFANWLLRILNKSVDKQMAAAAI